MSAAESYLDQRIRLVELRELECQVRERKLAELDENIVRERRKLDAVAVGIVDASPTGGPLVIAATNRILELELLLADALALLADALEQRDAARTLAARLEAETASCPTWIFHQLDESFIPSGAEK